MIWQNIVDINVDGIKEIAFKLEFRALFDLKKVRDIEISHI